MKANRGFILIIVLLFLQIIALFSLYALKAYWVENKLSKMVWEKNINMNTIENFLIQVESTVSNSAVNCFIPITTSQKLAEHTNEWWETRSCSGIFQTIQYYYVVERLGLKPCVHIQYSNWQGTEFYRITLLSKLLNHTELILLQTTIAVPSIETGQCDNNTYDIIEGRQSWQNIGV